MYLLAGLEWEPGTGAPPWDTVDKLHSGPAAVCGVTRLLPWQNERCAWLAQIVCQL